MFIGAFMLLKFFISHRLMRWAFQLILNRFDRYNACNSGMMHCQDYALRI